MKTTKGSLLVTFDLYFDEQSNLEVVLSPKRLHAEIAGCIKDAEMQVRGGFLDVWKDEDAGPATSFYSLAESHVRMSIPMNPLRLIFRKFLVKMASFVRMETWPVELQANGEVQLCNYSRDNTLAAQALTFYIIRTLEPRRAFLMLIKRGPDVEPHVYGRVVWERGMPDLPSLFQVRSQASARS